MEKQEIDGVVVLNKPKGLSSNTASNKVKYLLSAKKAGHLGTLDPMATGVLPVALGKATKLFDMFLKKRKTYIATFNFNYETDTLDSEGEILNNSIKTISEAQIRDILGEFTGNISQMPPKYSAKKVNGVRAYDLARKGVDFELKPKEITIYSIDLMERVEDNVFKLFIECSSGTYIRSICRDIAYRLGTYATMTDLIRTRCGIFSIVESFTIEDISNGNYKILSMEEILKRLG